MTTKRYLQWSLFVILFTLTLSVLGVNSSPFNRLAKTDECPTAFLVSSWFDNSIQVYDGCDNIFLGLLETNGLVKGPQSLVITPKGDLLVVSEGTNQLILFKRKAPTNPKSAPYLAQPVVVMDHADGTFIDKPVGALFDDQGQLFVASYSQNSIVTIDPVSWQIKDVVLSASDSAKKIKGVDAGFAIEGQRLFVPGYDSDNVIQINMTTKVISDVLQPNKYGLDAARSVFIYGDDLLISAERSNKILRINKDSFEQKADFAQIIRPASIVADGEQHILVTTRRGLVRFDLKTGEHQQLISKTSGHIKGGTYAIRLDKSLITPLITNPTTDLE